LNGKIRKNPRFLHLSALLGENKAKIRDFAVCTLAVTKGFYENGFILKSVFSGKSVDAVAFSRVWL